MARSPVEVVVQSLAIVALLGACSDDPAPLTADEVDRITPAAARAALEADDAVIVDVRSPSSYAAGHVRDAANIPEAELEGRLDELPREKLIITYCS